MPILRSGPIELCRRPWVAVLLRTWCLRQSRCGSLPSRPNERWSLDFVSDAFTDGRRFRVLAVVDDFTRECLCLVADTSLSGARLARELDSLITKRGKPRTIVSTKARK